MQTLDDYNKKTAYLHNAMMFHEVKMDVACPKCGEAIFCDLTMVFASNPPKRRAFCKNCGHTDYIY